MTARFFSNQRNGRGHRPRLQFELTFASEAAPHLLTGRIHPSFTEEGRHSHVTFMLVVALLFLIPAFGAGRSDVADAVMNGNTEALRLLLQQKADVNAPQPDGATA